MPTLVLLSVNPTDHLRKEISSLPPSGAEQRKMDVPSCVQPNNEQPAGVGPCLLDCWYQAALRTFQHNFDSPLSFVVATNTVDAQWAMRWTLARGFPQSCLIDCGNTKECTELCVYRAVLRAFRSLHIDLSSESDFLHHLPIVLLATPYLVDPDSDSSFAQLLQSVACEKTSDVSCDGDFVMAIHSLSAASFVLSFAQKICRSDTGSPFSGFHAMRQALASASSLVVVSHSVSARYVGPSWSPDNLRHAIQRQFPWVRLPNGIRTQKFQCTRFARVGLMGNPSDQLGGKSIALTIGNFWASATIEAAEGIILEPNQLLDPVRFASIHDVVATSQKNGYAGGLRLLQAAVKRFGEVYDSVLKEKTGKHLSSKGFCLSYTTNIPRQVGLAGSSAIVSAAFGALSLFFNVPESLIDEEILPSLVLSVEMEELGIHAGLMDRVIQAYEGCMLMDFSTAGMKQLTIAPGVTYNVGTYSRLPLETIPELYLVYALDPSDSGRIHSDVKERYKRGDPAVLAAAKQWAELVDATVDALSRNDSRTFAQLMDKNFDLRLEIYGERCLGAKNIRMVEIARAYGASAKFPGSGGAVLLYCPPTVDLCALDEAFMSEGFVFIRIQPHAR